MYTVTSRVNYFVQVAPNRNLGPWKSTEVETVTRTMETLKEKGIISIAEGRSMPPETPRPVAIQHQPTPVPIDLPDEPEPERPYEMTTREINDSMASESDPKPEPLVLPEPTGPSPESEAAKSHQVDSEGKSPSDDDEDDLGKLQQASRGSAPAGGQKGKKGRR